MGRRDENKSEVGEKKKFEACSGTDALTPWKDKITAAFKIVKGKILVYASYNFYITCLSSIF